ncbi:MAG TPA: hypothetical protein VE955_07265 [Candidatus Dormibacteraeota bacterium]|nr:hypothetical protein [Candidatus Dormibacteraeota bacterium]
MDIERGRRPKWTDKYQILEKVKAEPILPRDLRRWLRDTFRLDRRSAWYQAEKTAKQASVKVLDDGRLASSEYSEKMELVRKAFRVYRRTFEKKPTLEETAMFTGKPPREIENEYYRAAGESTNDLIPNRRLTDEEMRNLPTRLLKSGLFRSDAAKASQLIPGPLRRLSRNHQ